MSTRTTQLDITGMSCANCSATVEDALAELDGVETANVNAATDEGSVEFDPEQVSLADIYEAIDAAGYGPSPRVGPSLSATCPVPTAPRRTRRHSKPCRASWRLR